MLVAPVNSLQPLQSRILEFKGLNKKSMVEQGELHDMKNLSSDEYPCLYQRKPRGLFTESPAECIKPLTMIQKRTKLAIIGYKPDGKIRFFYDGHEVTALGDLTEKTTMTAINSRICFFPENKAYNVVDGSVQNLGAEVTAATATLKIDTDAGTATLSMGTSMSVFKTEDVVEIEGHFGDFYYKDLGNATAKAALAALVKGVSGNDIQLDAAAFLDLTTAGVSEASCTDVRIAREIPKLKYIMESGNRLWGVSDRDNTIYACKLGDPTNWNYFQGTSMDSYYAEQGSDGEWTGCAAYSNHLMFFKEGVIHKVYGSTPSSYQITTTQCYGLEKGSSKSVAIVNDTVIYKSQIGFMAYSGDTPYCISQKFGSMHFNNVVAGSNGLKYYASIHDMDTDEFWILVLDTDRGLWHKEDNVRVREFCFLNNKLLFIADKNSEYFEADRIYVVDAPNGLPQEKNIEWWAEIGPFDEFLPASSAYQNQSDLVEEKKIYSRIDMRLNIEPDTVLDFYIKMDDGDWEYIDRKTHTHGKVLQEVFMPRRCNKFSVRIEGQGNCRIDSLRRRYRIGTGGNL